MENKLISLNEAIIIQINKYLGKQDLTQYELAKRSSVPYATIKSIMQKRTKGIELKTIILIANGFKISLSEFLDDKLFNVNLIDI